MVKDLLYTKSIPVNFLSGHNKVLRHAVVLGARVCVCVCMRTDGEMFALLCKLSCNPHQRSWRAVVYSLWRQ